MVDFKVHVQADLDLEEGGLQIHTFLINEI